MERGGYPSSHQTAALPEPVFARLAAQGYINCYRFSPEVEGRFSLALCFGAMKHLPIRYPEIDSFLKKTWKQEIIKPLVELYQQCTSLEAAGSVPEFWKNLRDIAMNFFMQSYGCDSEKAMLLRQRGDIHAANSLVMQHCSDVLMTTVFHLQETDSSFMETCYQPKSNSVGLVIVLLELKASLYLLLHHELASATGSHRLPFYTKAEDRFRVLEGSVPAPTYTNPSAASTSVRDKATIEHVGALAKAFTEVILVMCPSLTKPQRDSLAALTPALTAFDQFNSVAKLTFPFDNDLLALKDVIDSQSGLLEGEHYLTDCLQYNQRDEYTVLRCAHKFHTSCLASYLNGEIETIEGSRAFKDITCPIDSLQISDDIISATDWTVLQRYQALKRSVLGIPVRSEIYSREHVQAKPQRPQFHCVICCRWEVADGQYLCESRCVVCLRCAQGRTFCPVCGKAIAQQYY